MKTFAGLFMLIMAVFINAWSMMLLVGVIHNDWISALPTLGYGTAVKLWTIIIVFTFVVMFMRQMYIEAASKD
jgi:hypothetical protein